MWSRPPTEHIEQLVKLPTSSPLSDSMSANVQSPRTWHDRMTGRSSPADPNQDNNLTGLLLGAGARTVSFRPWRGAWVSDWSETHRQSLLDAIGLWLGMLDDGSSEARWPKISA